MRGDWSEGEMEASPPRLCLSRDREVTLLCLEQQQAAPAPLGRSSPSKGAGQSGYPIPGPGTSRNAPPNTLLAPTPTGPSDHAPGHQLPLFPTPQPLQQPGRARRWSLG